MSRKNRDGIHRFQHQAVALAIRILDVVLLSFKPMISRWGVCRVKGRSICYSTYLLLLPDWCVEHVVVHELCHLLEPSHNAHFHALMDKYYPRWREARKETRRISKG